jgi:DNA polymerase-3 subunit gamma/tau
VLSRCQRFDLKRIETDELSAHLAGIVTKEGAAADPTALMLIARAAEGSVRDALSILDRAIAFSSGKVETGSLRGLLGLADRDRIFDLLETIFSGNAGNALQDLDALNRDGAEPAQVIADLADAVHAITRIKAAGGSAADAPESEAERTRATQLASRLSMPVLARAWQMLLKGYDEVRAAPRPLAAADMVLVRIAYAADLPTPSDLRRGRDEGRTGSEPQERSRPAPAPAPRERDPVATAPSMPNMPEFAPVETAVQPSSELHNPQNFEDLVGLAEAKRDLKLKHALLEQLRLVRFRPGHLEINPLPAAPRELGQELMRKLKSWTGRVWIVAVSAEEGAEPLGAQRRAREASEIERIREHPDVKQVLQHFPDARIAAVRSTETERTAPDPEPEPFQEDGTN